MSDSPVVTSTGYSRSLPLAVRERALSAIAPFLSLAVVIVLFYVIPHSPPVTLLDVRTVAVHTVIVGLAAMGMTFVIISGGIDLSVGSVIALSSVATALVLKHSGPLWLAILVALATGAVCGLYNALLITLLRLPPFIATLGTLGFFRGVAKWLSASIPVNIPADAPARASLDALATWVYPVPTREWLLLAPAVWLMLAVAVLLAVVLRYTVLGRHTFAIGSNEATAWLCGIRVPLVKIRIYVLAGLLTGLAGLMQFARLTQGDPVVAIGLELDVIAAVVIGGGSLAGGQGAVVSTLAGAFLMAYLRNRCTALRWPNFVQEMIVGHIIIVAVAIDQWRLRRMER
ncbi:MAG TPA: ABC transporter permease [Phycisphaerae bacterium]|nr:ABC transporter permease [Phycisphaerae bacterium]